MQAPIPRRRSKAPKRDQPGRPAPAAKCTRTSPYPHNLRSATGFSQAIRRGALPDRSPHSGPSRHGPLTIQPPAPRPSSSCSPHTRNPLRSHPKPHPAPGQTSPEDASAVLPDDGPDQTAPNPHNLRSATGFWQAIRRGALPDRSPHSGPSRHGPLTIQPPAPRPSSSCSPHTRNPLRSHPKPHPAPGQTSPEDASAVLPDDGPDQTALT